MRVCRSEVGVYVGFCPTLIDSTDLIPLQSLREQGGPDQRVVRLPDGGVLGYLGEDRRKKKKHTHIMDSFRDSFCVSFCQKHCCFTTSPIRINSYNSSLVRTHKMVFIIRRDISLELNSK